ncbi:hypothetical protein BDV24DRAFT_170442 [Aspergillus arachidicola]|uniref:Uncharacterized protein n=1 Tax=Aspergillus arachidicola TaxID=656916 RepID=A0A5N6XMU8_9EURO|nr:hypothetical protein BDV24DRAFT_170442 [Aspergillus arachidicola]
MSLYTEQYDAAVPIIASLLWSSQAEQPTPIVKQLKLLNTQIQAKNSQNRRRQDDGTLDLDLFTWLHEQIKDAAFHWPETWNIEWEQFMEYYQSLPKQQLRKIPFDKVGFDVGHDSDAQLERHLESKSDFESSFTANKETQDQSGPESNADSDSDSDSGSDAEPDSNISSDLSSWKLCTMLNDVQVQAEKKYGIPFKAGSILGWCKRQGHGYTLIIRHQYHAKRMARVVSATSLPPHIQHMKDIASSARVNRGLNNPSKYDSRFVKGLGLVAYAVNNKLQLDPTSSLHPRNI